MGNITSPPKSHDRPNCFSTHAFQVQIKLSPFFHIDTLAWRANGGGRETCALEQFCLYYFVS